MVVGLARVGESLIKQWFENVVEKVSLPLPAAGDMGIVYTMSKEVAEEIFAASSPIKARFDTEPSFLLQEVEEDDLAK